LQSSERRKRAKQELREKIFDAARTLFAHEGYSAVTMRRIAEKIEYSATAIYTHFKDKEALMHELCASDFLTLMSHFKKIFTIADPVERLRQLGALYADFAIKHPNHYRLMFMTPRPFDSTVQAWIEKGNPQQDSYALLKAAVQACIEEGHFNQAHRDADLLAQALWSAVHGLVSLHITLHNDPWIEWRPLKKTLRTLLDALVCGFTSKTARPKQGN